MLRPSPQTPHNRISKQVTGVSICVHNLYDIAVHFRSVGRLHLRSVIPRTYSLWTRRIDANDRSGNVGREKLAGRVFRTAGEGVSPPREVPQMVSLNWTSRYAARGSDRRVFSSRRLGLPVEV